MLYALFHVFCFASIVDLIYYSCHTITSIVEDIYTIAVIVLQLCCGEFVYRQANLCSGLRRISLSSIYKKRNLHFLAEVVLEPGSSDPETSTLPMSYCADDEETSFDKKYIPYY